MGYFNFFFTDRTLVSKMRVQEQKKTTGAPPIMNYDRTYKLN